MLDLVLTIIIAVGAGAAASLALTADPRIVANPWGQIIDAMIGVEIAISLLPPASVIRYMLPSNNDFFIAYLFSSVLCVRNNSISEAELERN